MKDKKIFTVDDVVRDILKDSARAASRSTYIWTAFVCIVSYAAGVLAGRYFLGKDK